MSLKKLDIFNVRNIREASLLPSSGINIIYGNNASGKSSLLEAIFILGRARSFRSSVIKRVINFDSNHLIVSGKAIQKDGNISNIGVRMEGGQKIIRIDKENKKGKTELAYALPLQLIHPKSYQLLDSGPQIRREFMDWGIFNFYSEYLSCWRKFKKALGQRNILLKKRQIRQLDVWNINIAKYGTIVAEYRKQYIHQLTPYFLEVADYFFDFGDIDISVSAGWNMDDVDLYSVLTSEIDKDLRFGYTTNGPHHGDFCVLINNKIAKDFVSRGQQKLLVLALKLAQIKLLHTKYSKIGTVLIDDLASELDCINRNKLFTFLSEMNFQVFLTATGLNEFNNVTNFDNYKMFHVEQGLIKQV